MNLCEIIKLVFLRQTKVRFPTHYPLAESKILPHSIGAWGWWEAYMAGPTPSDSPLQVQRAAPLNSRELCTLHWETECWTEEPGHPQQGSFTLHSHFVLFQNLWCKILFTECALVVHHTVDFPTVFEGFKPLKYRSPLIYHICHSFLDRLMTAPVL